MTTQLRLFVLLPSLLLMLYAIVLSLACHRCTTTKANTAAPRANDSGFKIPYDLEQPQLSITLREPELQEISGLSPTEQPSIFAAISDEKGAVLFLDIKDSGKITQRVSFKEKGDFEGVEVVNNTIYAIQSNSHLFEITNWQKEANPTIASYKLGIDEVHDIEGLCYDTKRNALLIACKEDPEQSGIRAIWGFDLATKTKSEQPIYQINPDQVDELVSLSDEDKQRHFSISGIAIHPISGDIYLVSTALKRLVVVNYATGAIKGAVRLNRHILPQPEGISFDQAGNLIISSEAKKTEASIHIFDQKK